MTLDIQKTNIPNIRVLYRYQTWHRERTLVFTLGGDSPRVPYFVGGNVKASEDAARLNGRSTFWKTEEEEELADDK